MDPRLPRRAARFALLLLALLPLPSRALAAGRPGGNRAAVATGPQLERSAPLLGERLRIVAASRGGVTDTVRVAAALDLAFAEARRLEAVFAPDGAGELAGLNGTAAGRRVACSAELFAALDAAVALADETDGAYDATDGPLLRVWDRRGGGRAPEAGDLAAARLLVGRRMLLLDPLARTARFIRPGMELALGAVARGALLERVADALRERGIVRARLELGGDVLAFTNYDAWSAAIPGPADPGQAAVTLMISNAAVATARSGREGSGRVLDPRTGQLPLGTASVTVVERSALRARALAEALLVQGRDDAAGFAQAHPGTGVLWLEPGEGSVRAWAWNLGRVLPAPDAQVDWMTGP
jgi:FAD:protein FMN transferase